MYSLEVCATVSISTHSLTRRLTTVRNFCIIISYISTHSLTRRLTVNGVAEKDVDYISTHSLTRRLTVTRLHISETRIFQLTASQGG